MRYKFLFIALCLLPFRVEAQETRDQAVKTLMAFGMPSQLAVEVAGLSTGLAILPNNTYATARNAANSANVNVWKVNASDNTVLNSYSAGDKIILQAETDANRLLTYGAASDTAFTLTFGDGATAGQDFYIGNANTSDTNNDTASLAITAGGLDPNISKGAYLWLYGNENSGAVKGDWYLRTGDVAASGGTGHLSSRVATLFQRNQGGYQTLWTLDAANGTWTSDATNGGDIVFGTNTPKIGSAGSLSINPANDANRLITFDSTNDTNTTMKWGDGSTAGQLFIISASDTNNTGYIAISGGKSYGTANGGNIEVAGVSHASAGSITLYPANGASAHIKNVLTNASSTFQVTDGSSAVASINRTGQITSAGTSDLGWTVKASGAGVDCNTACTSACVAGQNATFGLVSCATAVTGFCICAGAS